MVTAAPFPMFTFAENIGAVGRDAIVVAKGLIYFINPRGKMAIMDGTKFLIASTFPHLHDIDDVWENVNQDRLSQIKGFFYTGKDFEHVVWLVPQGTSTTNNVALIWDIRNQVWLRHPSGFKANVAVVTQDKQLYTGHYDSFVYHQDVDGDYSDASESPGAIDGYWKGGWLTPGGLQESIRPFKLNVVLFSQLQGQMTVQYGYDFNEGIKSQTLNMATPGGIWGLFNWGVGNWGAQDDLIRTIFLRGRGNSFQVIFQNATENQHFRLHGWSISGVPAGQKLFGTV